ncbi:MAG TPA: hypothetical protein VHC86_12880 [Opitutaceae bacterium]|nr:hypothetical protein [Opitutaceae bacterium]
MLKTYTIEYSLRLRRRFPSERQFFYTDDPLACEDAVQDLLERGALIHTVKHDGADLPPAEFDRVVKVAASAIAAARICASLHIKPEEERFRFGFTA